MKAILLQTAGMVLGFIGGVMYMREVYKPLVREMKRMERETRRRDGR